MEHKIQNKLQEVQNKTMSVLKKCKKIFIVVNYENLNIKEQNKVVEQDHTSY
jgi:hypothetical protein